MADLPIPIRTLDLIAILVYLGGMVGIALYFARRNTSTEEYFVVGRSFAGWVIEPSMLGTFVPTWMALGQAAGTAAHLCLKHDCPARNVPIPELQEELTARAQVLSVP